MSVMSQAADLLDPPEDRYFHDPAGWVSDKLDEHLWSAQVQVTESVRDHRYTAVHSAHNTGKSFIAGRTAAWWLDTRDDAFVVTTAPTFPQVRMILWKEISRAHRAGGLDGRVNQTEWWMGGEPVAYGRKPADYNQQAFQGIHERYVLVIIDEAYGVPKGLFDAVDTLATNENARVLAIGNPDDPSSHFAKICRPGSGWNVIGIDGLHSPGVDRQSLTEALDEVGYGDTDEQQNLRGELLQETPEQSEDVPDEIRPLLLSPTWIAERALRWGVDSPLFTSKVRGRFPEDSDDTVIPLSWVRKAQQRWQNTDQFGPQTCVGVDVARSGQDRTVLAHRHGWAITELERHRRQRTTTTAAQVQRAVQEGSYAVVDVVGIGAGVYDQLVEQGVDADPFSAGSSTDLVDESGQLGFVDARSAAWWNLRLALEPDRGVDVALPDDEQLTADLTAPRWELRAGGRIKVESKDDISDRLGRSTDDGDAVVQAFFPRRQMEDRIEDVGAHMSISPI